MNIRYVLKGTQQKNSYVEDTGHQPKATQEKIAQVIFLQVLASEARERQQTKEANETSSAPWGEESSKKQKRALRGG